MSKKYIQNCTGNLPKESSAGKFGAFLSRLIFQILFLGFLGVSAYVLFFSDYLKITNIDISGNQELGTQEIKRVLENSFQGKILGMVPRNNFLFFSQKKIGNILTDNFKKIRSVSVTKKFPDSVSINIDERKALLIWCSNGECFILDENGTAYNKADFDAPELSQNNLIKIDDVSMRTIAIGEKVADSSYERYVLDMKGALDKAGYNVSGYYTPSSVSNEIDIKTEQGTDIYFSTEFPLESAMSTIAVVFKKEITKEQRENIAYIDLRSENKVFYKLKGEKEEENAEQKDGQKTGEEIQQ